MTTAISTSSTAERDAAHVAPAVRVRNVMVSYEGRPVLRSVTFDAQPGEMIGIIGPNGAGKSTLLKAVLGLIPTDSGTVEVYGEPIARRRTSVAYVPQTEAVDWDFPVTVFDVVLMGRAGRLGLFKWPGRADREAAIEALELVGMAKLRDRHIRRLSGGQQQRVFLARALCQEADVLLLDEPFAGIDAATEQAIFALIRRLTADDKTLLVVNHDLGVLDRFDRLLMLNQRVVAFGPPHEAASEENLKITYGGRLTMLERAEAQLKEAPTDH